MSLQQTCPCGSGATYDACCGRLHRGSATAVSAVELMRARYAAYAVDELDYVFRTWHPRTRPDAIEPDPALTWTGLEIVDSGEDWVEFVASYTRDGVAGERRERSTFELRRGEWVYVGEDA
ncbi:SEC-C domain-containing protein [Nocardioides sp. cx-169]|uniref:YchJ family protein n=1 Tax=Nocardioides sp. cx-169 TaxID=2899080 RepID=UPI001E2D5D52|nr:YchJ family metal-binding protein [Nocardioides sp. cx-169]MCD4536392.1 SEC-C domain-containing protein [Nocardioides sp. cx-169]